jgi:antitoxin component of MazEF toxin-antitoxin module
MILKVRRKIVNRRGESGMVTIPPIFLENMGAQNCTDVIMTVPDINHILIEIIRPVGEKI